MAMLGSSARKVGQNFSLGARKIEFSIYCTFLALATRKGVIKIGLGARRQIPVGVTFRALLGSLFVQKHLKGRWINTSWCLLILICRPDPEPRNYWFSTFVRPESTLFYPPKNLALEGLAHHCKLGVASERVCEIERESRRNFPKMGHFLQRKRAGWCCRMGRRADWSACWTDWRPHSRWAEVVGDLWSFRNLSMCTLTGCGGRFS